MKQLLSSKGTIYIHLDWRANTQTKIILDELFSGFDFHEIIWLCGLMGHGKYFPKAHETIFCYRAPDSYFEPPQRLGLSQRIIKALQKDSEGWYYTRGKESSGGSTWLKTYISNNAIHSKKEAIDFANENRSQPVWSVWIGKDEIAEAYNDRGVGTYAFTVRESVDYPTQKPEALLKRIIEASCPKDGLVADFFAGSGTTLTVAEKLNRRWIGVDLGRYSIHTIRKRLLDIQDSPHLDNEKKYLKSVKPFEILNLGKYERQFWQVKAFGRRDERQALYEYLAFILKLYGAEPIAGSSHIHGKKGNALVYVGAVDAPVTIQEVTDALNDTREMGQKELHVLGWEWEMGLNDAIQEVAKQMGIRLKLRIIPMDAIDPQAAGKGDVRFFELAYFKTDIVIKGLKAEVKLEDFVIPHTDLIPPDVKESIKKWSDWIDYWAVDFEFRNDTFNNGWTSYRTKQERKLRLTAEHTYTKPGTYKVFVKIIDIFGIDTSQVYEINVS